MAFTHPDIDNLVAEHKLHSEAISLLRRQTLSEAESKRKAEHPLLQDLSDVPATLAALLECRDELQQEIADKVAPLRKAEDEKKLFAEMTLSESLYGALPAEELEAALSKANSDAEAASKYLRMLQLEARRRRGADKAVKELAKLSPQAKAMLAQQIEAKNVPAETKVRS